MELTVDHALKRGVAAHKQGKLEEAEGLYRTILASDRNHPDANHNLGVLLVSIGRPMEAIPFFRIAVEASPQVELFWLSYFDALINAKQFDEATKALEDGGQIAISREQLGLLNQRLLGLSTANEPPQERIDRLLEHYQTVNFREAEALALSLTQQFPRHPFAWKVLGAALKQTGRLIDSLLPTQKAAELSPHDAQAHSNLGGTLQELGRLVEAEASCKRAISLDPRYPIAHSHLGNTLKDMDKLSEAEASYRRAIALKPDYADAYYNLGVTLNSMGRSEEAEGSYRQAIILEPNFARAHNNLGMALQERSEFDGAEASFRRAIALKPDYIDPHNNLCMLIGSMRFKAASYKLCAENFSQAVQATVKSRFKEWLYNRNSGNLRIGFVSGDLMSHPVGYFLEALLTELKSSSIELFAYPTQSTEDELTRRVKPFFQAWQPLVGLNDEEAAKRIHEDGNHVLIDLSGHTTNNRLPVFAWKPAPIQVSWLGYFASTGLPEMDYILGDRFVTPCEEADHFVEKIWQLPDSYLCFTPPNCGLPVAPLPALSNGFVTFGCFNKLSRMTDEVISVRVSILKAVPDSKLFLKDRLLNHEWGRNRILSKFGALDISADRLILEGTSPREEYLACYNRIDIALSPFPYGGGTTSVEGLWMGVPVIAKRGNYFLSHLGESIAYNAGLAEWIAENDIEYVAKAVAHTSDLSALAALRSGMRKQLLASPLLDARKFAEHFERAAREMRNAL
jgi:predicted O-linked N-acetylglucosamine transferase (SPINDLY family)